MSNTIWILTEEYSAYDQYGEYFVAAFKAKPTVKELQKLCDVDVDTAKHIWNGGGIRSKGNHYDRQWYLLKEYDLETCKFVGEIK